MNRNRIVKKAAVIGLSMTLAAGQMMTGIPDIAKAEKVTKQENVFVNLDANGKTRNIIVTDWIKNVEGTNVVKDFSELTEIENVKGEETFTQSANEVLWAAKNADIYYQGKIKKELPVKVDITYKIDGKEMKAEELPGKSGKLEMHIEYTNTAKETITVDNKEMEVNVPFVMLTGIILPTDRFKNVEIDHGKIMSDADKQIVVGVAMPGLEESLDLSKDLKEDIDIPESLTITADVENFEMGATFTVASAELMKDVNASEVEVVDELKDSMEELKDASGKLVDGTQDMADGIGTLQEKSGEFTDGITTLSDGLGQLNTGARNLETGIKTYTAGADRLAAGIKKLGAAIKGLPEKLGELVSGISSAEQGADQLIDNTAKLEKGMESVNGGIDTVNTTLSQVNAVLGSIEGADKNPQLQKAIYAINAVVESTGEKGSLKEGASAVEAGLSKLQDGQKALQTGLGTMQEGVAGLAGQGDSMSSLTGALDQLGSGADALSKNSAALVKGAAGVTEAALKLQAGGNKLDTGADALGEGINELKDGSIELKDGMKEFNEDGIMKLYNIVNDDIDKMFDRLDAISKAGVNYNSFAGIHEDMDGTVRFIMETDEIK